MTRTVKTYKLNRDYSIDCITITNIYGEKKYNIYVVLECVPWREILRSFENITDATEANTKFIQLKNEYKNKFVYSALV